MTRFVVLKRQNGQCVSHGTILLIEEAQIWITSHCLDEAYGTEYLVSLSGLLAGAQPIVRATEILFPAQGVAQASIPPHVYQLTLGEPQ